MDPGSIIQFRTVRGQMSSLSCKFAGRESVGFQGTAGTLLEHTVVPGFSRSPLGASCVDRSGLFWTNGMAVLRTPDRSYN